MLLRKNRAKDPVAGTAMAVVTTVVYSGNPNFDGLLSGTQWASTNLTFSFPTDSADYNFGYIAGGAPSDDFAPLNAVEQQTALAVLHDYAAISNLQFTPIIESTTLHANLREAQSAQAGAAMTFAPNPLFNEYPLSADSWYDPGTTSYGELVENPVLGGYGFYAFLHEIGIALGLNDDVQGTDLAAAYDSMAYSVESYRSYVGAPTMDGLSNATWAYAQSPMMDDIAAVQQMYGANYSAAGTTVVYSWSPTTGEEYINGLGQGVPGGDTVFMTIWDQGAAATYDLSNYTTNLDINLQPGEWSTFSTAQLAVLGADASGNPILAPGNVANALEYDNNPASLITSIIGGSGHNTIVGNNAGDYIFGGTSGGNVIQGGSGHNTIDGGAGGNNTLVFTGDYANYQVTAPSNQTLQFVDLRSGSPDGTDQVTDIQNFQFTDGTYTLQQLQQAANPPVAISAGLNANNNPIEDTALTATISFADPQDDAPASAVTYVWFVNGNQVQSGSSAVFTPGASDEGKTVSVTASYTDQFGNAHAVTSGTTDAVLAAPPTVTASGVPDLPGSGAPNINAIPNETFAASSLFSASDPDGAPILAYRVIDASNSASSGFWVLGNEVLPANQAVIVSAAQLSQLSFVAGSPPAGAVPDVLQVSAADAGGFGATTTFTVDAAQFAPNGGMPVVTAANQAASVGTTFAAASLFSASAPGGDTILSYEVVDATLHSGNWILDGVVEPANQTLDLTAAQLSQLSFQTNFGAATIMVRANDGSQWSNYTTFQIQSVSDATPAGATSDMVLEQVASGNYEIYDIGGNTILAAYALGQLAPQWQVIGMGGFNGADTSDIVLRNSSTGQFEVADISGNNITNVAFLGQVGLDWSVAGFGDFSSNAGETDMLMRNGNTGAFEVYDISNNQITFAAAMGKVGLEWQVAGFGDFSSNANETDMLLRDGNTGAFEIYDIANNQITFAAGMGQVGLEWQIAGFGDFSGNANETDMLLRNGNTGAFEIYDIANNNITLAAAMGQVGLEWQTAGFGDFSGNANETDMLLRNGITGAFEVYDISHNQITVASGMGQVGMEWSVAGGSQLAQAMAAFAPATSTPAFAPGLIQAAAEPITTPALTATANSQMHPIA
jgi:hypothetical protein